MLEKLILLLVNFFFVFSTPTSDDWKSRSIYQLLTDRFQNSNKPEQKGCSNLSRYCGGTFNGVMENLDYIQNLGYDAIWISPIIENTENGYHGYWFKNLWKINPNFGTEEDFVKLIEECHERDIYVMVDIVLNHVGNIDEDFYKIFPFNESVHYHKKCQIEDWDNQEQVEYCRLCNLPDLDQDNDFVKEQLFSFLLTLKEDFNVDGFRLDTTPLLSRSFLREVKDLIGDMFITGEVLNGQTSYCANYAKDLGSVLSYPMYFTLKDVFGYQNSMHGIENRLKEYKRYIEDPFSMTLMLNNHDQERFLHYQKSYTLFKNALVYVHFSKNIPILYYGSEQAFSGGNDPKNREYIGDQLNRDSQMYKYIQLFNNFRNDHKMDITSSDQITRFVDEKAYCWSRERFFFCTTNGGKGFQKSIVSSNHPFKNGETVCDLFTGWCTTIANGNIYIQMENGLPMIFYLK